MRYPSWGGSAGLQAGWASVERGHLGLLGRAPAWKTLFFLVKASTPSWPFPHASAHHRGQKGLQESQGNQEKPGCRDCLAWT